MENKVKYIISSVLNIEKEKIGEKTNVDTVSNWDSLNHIKILTLLEDEFNVEFDDEQILKMNSYNEILIILNDTFS